jgi:hypothetical protein
VIHRFRRVLVRLINVIAEPMPTPPLTVSTPMQVPLDPATKAAQTIAQIKKRAYAETDSSPEVAPVEFNDDLDDDSDDDFPPVLHRYSLRSRSPLNSNRSGLLRESLSRKCPSPPRGKKTVAYDPFDTLLREKKRADKSGKGHDAFCRAETTTDEFGEDRLLDGGNGDDLSLGDAERRNFFGEDGGKAIMGILEHDKIAKREVLNRQVPSLRFWSLPGADNTAMVVDEAPSTAEISDASPLICLLKKSIQRGGMFELLFFFPSHFHNLFQTSVGRL